MRIDDAIALHDLRLVRREEVFRAALCVVRLNGSDLLAYYPSDLGEFERVRYETFKSDKRRLGYLGGRLAARRALCRLRPHLDPALLDIGAGVFGQPVIDAPRAHGLQVSISHTELTAAALAFPEAHPMGLDVERIAEGSDSAIRSQLTSREADMLRSLPLSSSAGCTLLWTAKESLSKVLKCGMMAPFTLLEIDQIVPTRASWVSTFRHFAQYKAVGEISGDEILTITLPKRTEMETENSEAG